MYSVSNCSWIDHLVSGPITFYSTPFSDSFSLRLHFRLSLQNIITRPSIIQKVRRHPSFRLRLLVCTRFQVLFHYALTIYFNFHSHYSFTIGVDGIFNLRGLVPLSSNSVFPELYSHFMFTLNLNEYLL